MRAWAFLLLAIPLAAADIATETQAALNRISPQSLKGHLSFISSDLLEGRESPSRGLDIAAGYIAAQFRRAGLEPAGDDGYFQTAKMVRQRQSAKGWSLHLALKDSELKVDDSDLSGIATRPLNLTNAPVFKVTAKEDVTPDLRNAVVLVDVRTRNILRSIRDQKPAAIVYLLSRKPRIGPKLIEAAAPTTESALLYAASEELSKTFAALPAGRTEATASLTAPGPTDTPGTMRNVIGVLRGSDPILKDTYVFVTAHYDHLGMKAEGEGDRIFNGANDNGSGTVSVIELAGALASLEHHPKRSIVFMTVFGEEEGLIGSKYYGSHPVFPFAKTVADLNLEQLGRTDDLSGERKDGALVTGLEYSEVGKVLIAAGEKTGIQVGEDAGNTDEFFARSDNLSFAEKGVPAHTIGVAYEFPDYHKVSDEWQKIDFDNMAKVDRMLATALLMLADNPEAPKWNGDLEKTAPYRLSATPPAALPAASGPGYGSSPATRPQPQSAQ